MIKKFFKRLNKRLLVKLGVQLEKVKHKIAYETLPEFGGPATDIEIALPRTIVNPERIFLGNRVRLGPGALLYASTGYPTSWTQNPAGKQPVQKFDPKITIGNAVSATAGLQVAAHSEVTIEDDVMFASNVNITDGLHAYENANEPYKYQGIFKIAPVLIKRGCWIGQNVVILPGVTIGEYTIIGANSVVTKSIPDRCIAVGSPAQVIKKWDESVQRWLAVDDTV